MTKEQRHLIAAYIQLWDVIEDDMWGGALPSIALNAAQKDYLRTIMDKIEEYQNAAEPLLGDK